MHGNRSHHPTREPGAAVVTILSEERHYGDGPPQWLEGRNRHPCQTAEQAEIERRRLIKRLRRFGKHHAPALAVSDRIEGCAVRRRCMSGACPECARAWQRWFVKATATFFVEETGSLPGGTILSPIHRDGMIEPGQLAISPLSSLAHTVVDALTSIGTEVAVLGLDISFNEHVTGDFNPHWLAHFRIYLLQPCRSPPRRTCASTSLQEIGSGSRSRWLGSTVMLAGIAYAMKPRFERRQSYHQFKPTADGTRECRNTRGRPCVAKRLSSWRSS
jgi:hypothetical protein